MRHLAGFRAAYAERGFADGVQGRARACTHPVGPRRLGPSSHAARPLSTAPTSSSLASTRPIHCHASAPHAGDAATQEPESEPTPADSIADAATLVGSAWDPEGIFSKSSPPINFAAGAQMGDLIARRERERAARRAASNPTPTPSPTPSSPSPFPSPSTPSTSSPPEDLPPLPAGIRPIRPLPASVASLLDGADASAGVPVSSLPAELVSEVEALLAAHHMPVDLQYNDAVRVVHLDPPVLTVDGFLSEAECEAMVAAALASGKLSTSRIGAGNAGAQYGGAAQLSGRRTSSGMVVTRGSAGPAMDNVVSSLHAKGRRLLCADRGPAWGPSGKLPQPGQYCYESLQVARYEAGQHFLAHEDGFPPPTAASNGFQRHATLLVYLNTCERGGATRFDQLGLAVRPVRGRALLFFPALADGAADPRSLHTAEDAVDTKWVTQQWIARGLQAPKAAGSATATTSSAASAALKEKEAQLEERERAGRQAKASKAAKATKGFGKAAK